MFPKITPYERNNMRTFFAHPKARQFPNDPRAIFGVLERQHEHYQHCVLPQRAPILVELEGRARQVLTTWRQKRFGGK